MIRLADACQESLASDHIVACDANSSVTWARFHTDLDSVRRQVSGHAQANWSLFEDDTYRFTVGLFALLAEGRRIYLPGENNQAATASLKDADTQFLGLFPYANSFAIELDRGDASEAPADFKLTGEVAVHTSGSTGRPKTIVKSLRQLDAEIETLERLWGQRLGDSLVLSGVNHQHLYGLLFMVLWPLCAGRSFWSKRFDSPATLIAEATRNDKTAWIMSPAHLHRLDDDLPWNKVTGSVTAVFSSGGLLREPAARHVCARLGYCPIEVLGSSETGGIAWREQVNADEPWRPLSGIRIDRNEQGALMIRSPFLPDGDWHITDDAIHLLPNGRFLLGQRLDRIVKIEGKRVSLPAIETTLQKHPWVEEVYAVPLNRRRQCVGALLVPTPRGDNKYRSLGHHCFGQALRKHCRTDLAAVAVPRYWRLTDAMPRNSQGKVLQDAVQAMFAKTRLPAVLRRYKSVSGCRLVLLVESNSPYFEGHFPNAPILPGVTQLLWAEHFARQELQLQGEFKDMRVIKFKGLVHPGTELTLTLEWSPVTGRLEFLYESPSGPRGQGRMMFQE